jgi:hypothetical protein
MGSTGTSAMPYLHALISDYALANKFTAEEPGSVADYFDVTTGNHVSTSRSLTVTPVTPPNARPYHSSGLH